MVKRNLRCLDGVEVADEELLVEVVKDEVDERSRFSWWISFSSFIRIDWSGNDEHDEFVMIEDLLILN